MNRTKFKELAPAEDKLFEVELLLQVILAPEAGMWVAQAIEIDYAAAGDSLEDVKERFEDGLASTIHTHLEMFGNLDSLIVPAPPKQWRDLWEQKGKRLSRFSQTTLHQVVERSEFENLAQFFPFETINYYTTQAS
jgi:hypothetical protein